MKALALILFLSLLGTPQAATIVAEPFPPAQFTGLYIEVDGQGKTTSLRLAGDAIHYRATQDGKVIEEVTVHPSADAWFNFIQGLNNAKVYKWAPKYYYPGPGTTWVIDLTMNDRQFMSGGMNEYPKEGSERDPAADPKAGPSIPFQLFWQAALQLVGKATPAPPAK